MAINKPYKKISAGNVSAAIWENEAMVNGRTVSMLKVTLDRRYRNSAGEWKSSSSFARNEIPLAVYCLQKAFEVIIERGSEDNADDNAE